jgi:hypothetical protein
LDLFLNSQRTGLGEDSFIFASFGAEVLLVERHPVIFELLQDAHRRALAVCETSSLQLRVDLSLTLQHIRTLMLICNVSCSG